MALPPIFIKTLSFNCSKSVVGLPVPEPKWVQNLLKPKLQTCETPTAIAIENEVIR
jgi:hypothetical protein